MPGTVALEVDSFQHAGVAFDAQVIVTGVPNAASVTVSLAQTRGRPPLFSGQQVATKVTGGTAVLTFSGISLAGPTWAVLLATASDDQATFYPPDAERVQVL
jgi:hypothetical protein